MEELQMLINLVATLPAMAIWVLVGFYVYKVTVIGSIYGLIRLGIIKVHDWLTKPRRVEFSLDGVTVGNADSLFVKEQLRRLAEHGYLHSRRLKLLESAIDKVLAEDSKK